MITGDVCLSAEGGSLLVSGVLDFTTAREVGKNGIVLLSQTTQPVFDFSGVTYCNSAALALLTAWARAAKAMGKSAQFIHLPPQLLDVAKLSNIDKVLSLS